MSYIQAGSSIDPGGELCPDALLRIVSENIGKDVMKLGSAMGIKAPKMETIEVDEGKWGTEQIAFRTLDTWRKIQGENATPLSLVRILKLIGRLDIAKEIAANSSSARVGREQKAKETLLKGLGSDGPLTVERLQANLRKIYERLEMKGLPWMHNVHLSLEKHFVQMEIVKKMDEGENKSKEVVELEQLLTESKGSFGKQPSRILVEGDAGFGKTTLATKLCYDYSTRQDYLNHFDIVLYFALRNFGGNLDEMFCNAAFVTAEEQRVDLFKIVNDKSVRILVLLDGYDELPNQHADSILSLIRGEVLPHVTVLVTSRPGRLRSETTAGNTTFLNISQDVNYNLKPVWHLEVKLIGISHNRQPEFLDKHLSNFTERERKSIADQISQMKEMEVLTPDFLQCPLFILMIVLLLSQKTTVRVQYSKTRTELYKSVMNFVIRRYLTKHGASSASKADLFSFDICQRPFYVDLMTDLGEICLAALSDNSLSISQDTILGPDSTIDPKILDLGLLHQTITIRGFWEEECYEPVHKSLMEFVAAYFLWLQFISGPSDQWKCNIIKLRPTPATSESSLTLPFLAGLMGKDVEHIFRVLMPYAAEYTCSFNSLTSTLREVEMTDSLFSCLISFLPLKWETNLPYADVLPSQIMLAGLKAGKIEQIVLDICHPFRFHDDITVKSLVLIAENEIPAVNKSQLKRIECDTLICEFPRLYAESQWPALLSFLLCIQFTKISFVLSDYFDLSIFLAFVREAFTNGELKEKTIHYIECNITREMSNNVLDMLIDLIEKEQINALSIHLHSYVPRYQLDTLFKTISKSSSLTCFIFEDYTAIVPLAINLAQLHIDGRKSYDWLRIPNAIVDDYEQVQGDTAVMKLCELHQVKFKPSESPSLLFQSCQVQSFVGNCSILAVDAHQLHESLTELHLILDKSLCEQENFNGFSNFPNLRLLIFTMTPFEYQSASAEKCILEAVNSLPLLRYISIEQTEQNFPMARQMVESISQYLNKNSSPSSAPIGSLFESTDFPLTCVSLMFSTDPYESDRIWFPILQEIVSICSPLKQLLNENALSRLELAISYQSFFRYMSAMKPNGFSSFVEVFPPEEGFIIQYDIQGMREDDPLEHKMRWNTQCKAVNRLSVSFNSDAVTET